ncbi:MAG: choice-of-anchor P family protein, partial [Actinomycetota bacterium]
MRGIRGLLAAAVAVAGFTALPVRANHLPGGPIILMGIDAEDGGVGGHGPTSTYANVVNDLLGNATKGSGILVLGGGKNPTDHVTSFWNAVGAATGQTITYANGNAVGTVSFAPFEIVAIVSSEFQTSSGGLTTAENALLATRDLDIATQVNTGGGLLGFSQDGFSPLYPYLDEIGAFTVTAGGSDSDVTATAEGLAIGLDHTTLDVCCWHDTYVAFPSFLVSLALYTADTSRVAAIGGRNVHVLTICAPNELQVTITRPVAGRLYQDDLDIGSSGTPEAAARGNILTVSATTTNPAAKVDFFLDGLLVGTDTSAPFSFPVPLPLIAGLHTLKARALHANEPCVADGEAPLRIVCFDAVAAITRPVAGRLYQNDIDIGSSGVPEAAALGGTLTLNATSSLPARTLRVEFRVDGVLVGTDFTSPYAAAINTTPLTPGLHAITATVFEFVPTCDDSVSIGLRRPDPSVLGLGLGVKVATDVPTEAIVTAGGASIGGTGGSQDVRILDRNAPNIDHIRTIVDKADGLAGASGTATASSVLQSVSLMTGMITADVLESHASVTVNGPTQTVTTSDAGSRIVGLRVQGNPIYVSQPNTAVTVPGVGTLVLQETLPSTQGLRGELTVNALHLYLDPGYAAQEIVLGSAHAGVNFIGNAFIGPASDLIHREDDLHQGIDAGDTEATATALAEGIHSGAMSRGDVQDFYTFEAGQGDRIIAAVKPAERTMLRVNPLPAPPTLVHERPSLELYLRDPLGRIRSVGDLSAVGSEPQKVELNADTPYDPPGARGRWTLEVRRAAGSLDGFYTLEFSLLPVMLREQNDADVPGDASDTCLGGPRPIVQSPVPEEESDVAFAGVIREADGSDFYSINVQSGRVLTVTMKPDELVDGADFNLYLYGPSRTDGPVDCARVIDESTLGGDGTKALPDVVFRTPVITSGDYVFEVRRFNGVGNYYVNVNVTNPLPTIVDNDALTGTDASGACAATLPLQLGSGIYQGRLDDFPTNDFEDWYDVVLGPDQDLTVVMKPSE